MAGQIFDDPRPYYSITADQKFSFLDDLFGPGKKENKFIESAYRVKESGKQGGGGGNNANQKNKKKNNNEEGDEDEHHHEQSKKKGEEKSKTQIVEVNIHLCCDSCVWQVKEALDDVEGVERVDCDQMNRKVWVKGTVKPEVVLRKMRKIKKDAKLVEKKKQN